MALFKKSGKIDMTTGNPYKLILSFSLPLLLGNVFQQLYNMVDSIVVGNYINEKALAAVGTGFPIIFMLNSLFMGMGMGASIMISQYYGARDFKKVSRTVNTIYNALMIAIVPLTVLGVLVARPFLLITQVPDDGTLDMATVYVMTVLAGTIGSLGYNINAGILQGFGDSKTSLLFLLISSIINIVLDVVFTVFCGMGVFGVALATIIGQISSWIFGIFYINRRYSEVKIQPFKWQFDKVLFKQAMKLGIPSGIQQALFSIGIMMMNSLINSYGSSFMAGYNGASKIDSFAFMPIQSFSSAITTYTGQNVGANNFERVKKGFKAGIVMSCTFSILVAIILYPLSSLAMRLFSQNPAVLAAGETCLHSLLPFYALLAVMFMVSGVMRGAGEMLVPMICSLTSLWLIRVPVGYLLAHFFGKDFIFFSFPIGWVFGAVVGLIYYATGKWKKKRIIHDEKKAEEAAEN